MNTFLRRFSVACLVALVCASPAQAKRKPFGVAITATNGQGQPASTAAGFTTVSDTVDFLDPASLKALFPTADTDQIAAVLDFRGLSGISIDFGANNGLMTFTVPQLGNFTTTFGRTCDGSQIDCGAARKEALRQLRDFLESDPRFLKKLLTSLARYSPIDPLAGNPESLFSRSMTRDFLRGFTHKVSQIWGCNTSAFNFTNDSPIQLASAGDLNDIFAEAQARAAQLQAQNEIGLGVIASTTTAKAAGGDYSTTGYELPFSYTVKFDSDPRKKLRFDLPLSYTDTDGAVAYSIGLGVAYTYPISDVWSLTPSVGVGATGSDDLGSAGGVSSYSLTSAYTWRLGNWALSMGNALGKYDALGLKIGDVEAEADISNTVITNGFLFSGPNSLLAKNLVLEYSLTDTRITGDEVYTDTYDEIGVALGYIRTDMGVIDSYSKFGVSYVMASGDGEDINSLKLNLSVRF